MATSSFLECREHFVQVPVPIIRRVPQEILKIQPRVFKILASRKDLKLSMLEAASNSFTLPMPVHASPVVALLTSDPTTQDDVWRFRYIPFSDSYAELGQLFTATIGGLYEVDAEKLESTLRHFEQEGERQTNQLVDDLISICTSPILDDVERTSQFLCRLEIATITLLNRYETFLHQCLIGDEHIPLALCLTPMVSPTFESLHEKERARFFELFVQYWRVKVERTNEKLALDSDVPAEQWITLDGLTSPSGDSLWRGYLTPKTASEYMNYFTKVIDM